MGLAICAWVLAIGINLAMDLRRPAAVQAEIARLSAQAIPSTLITNCRIYLVGSSGVLMGLSAEAIANSTRCATVNVAIARSGELIDHMLTTTLHRLKPGDLVILGDRRWTDLAASGRSVCDDIAFCPELRRVSLVPALAFEFRRISVHRNRYGDLAESAFHKALPVPIDATLLPNMPIRIARAERQVNLIRSFDARPILAAIPMLVSGGAKDALGRQFAQLGHEMDNILGPGVWIPPALETEPIYFASDGHASAQGRNRWTAKVIQFLNGLCDRGGNACDQRGGPIGAGRRGG